MHLASCFTVSLLSSAPAMLAQQVVLSGYGTQPNSQTGTRVAGGGDLDGDGRVDLLVTAPGTGVGLVLAVSGANGTVRSFSHGPLGATFGIVPDANLDGRADVLVSTGLVLQLRSGATLAPLWTSTLYYHAAAPVGDRNGDGRGDLAAIRSASPQELHVLSGLDGSVLSLFPITATADDALIAIGDINGDGVTELAWGGSSNIVVLRLAASPVLLNIPVPGGRLAAANFVGDARNEIVAAGSGSGGPVNVVSATTGAVVRTFVDVHQNQFAVLGDLNADGVADLVVRRQAFLPGTVDYGDVVSGANGARLARWPSSAQLRCSQLTSLGDVDADGFGDFANGDPSGNATGPSSSPTGGWQIVSGKLLAFRESMPTNCGMGPFLPQLGTTLPRLGQTTIVAGQNAPPGSVGLLAFSLQPPVATNLGIAGCEAWFDLAGGSLLHTSTTPSWQFNLPLPPAPQLAGIAIALQSVYVPSAAPLGFDLSNGIWAHIGW